MRNIQTILIGILLSFFTITGFSQQTKLSLDIENYEQDTILIAYEILNRYPILDTIIGSQGHFEYESDTILHPGVYMMVLPPANEFVTVLLDGNENDIKIKSDFFQLTKQTTFTGSIENTRYYNYLNSISPKMKNLGVYRQNGDEMGFNNCADSIRMLQDDLISAHPKSFTAAILLLEKEPNLPAGLTDQMDMVNFRKAHYFDNTNMADPRLMRSRMFYDKIQYYIDKLTYTEADSINTALDKILSLVQSNPETYQYYLDHFMVSYASIDYIGLDAVYIHLVLDYYNEGKAPWFDKADIAGMVKEAKSLEPLILGKVAPDVELQKRDGTPIRLHEVDADFTIFYIWQPNCSHCEASHPFLKSVYKKYKDKGVEVLAACTKVGEKADTCWDYIDKHDMDQWINANDKTMKSRFLQKYMAQKTPKVFILDKDKKIIMKDIGADQIDEILKIYIPQ